METGKVVEVFDSIQGEGIIVGARQVFIRLSGCNLHCSYCDTEHGEWQEYTVNELMTKVEGLAPGFNAIHSVAITGGEPLRQVRFLRRFAQEVQRNAGLVYLETNGTMVDEMKLITDTVDYVAMDIKLEQTTGQPNRFDDNEEFLQVCYQGKAGRRILVKVVIDPQTQFTHLIPVSTIIRNVDSRLPVILQPVTGHQFTGHYLDLQKRMMLDGLSDVRVVPQIHRYLKVR